MTILFKFQHHFFLVYDFTFFRSISIVNIVITKSKQLLYIEMEFFKLQKENWKYMQIKTKKKDCSEVKINKNMNIIHFKSINIGAYNVPVMLFLLLQDVYN